MHIGSQSFVLVSTCLSICTDCAVETLQNRQDNALNAAKDLTLGCLFLKDGII